jgi:hypothetical protein
LKVVTARETPAVELYWKIKAKLALCKDISKGQKKRTKKAMLSKGVQAQKEVRAAFPTKSVHLTLNTMEEVVLPGGKGGHNALEDLSISLLQNFSGCYREDFHEEGWIEFLLGFLYGIEELEVVVPRESQVIPTVRVEGTLEY